MSSTFPKPAPKVSHPRRLLVLAASVGLTVASATNSFARPAEDPADVGAVAADDAGEFIAPVRRDYSVREGYCAGNLGAALLGGFATQEGTGPRRVVEC